MAKASDNEDYRKCTALFEAIEREEHINELDDKLKKRAREQLWDKIFGKDDPKSEVIEKYVSENYTKEKQEELRKEAKQILEESKAASKARKKKPDENTVYTSFVGGDGEIFEQVQGGEYIDKDGEVYPEINRDGINYRPIMGEELDRGIVLLPDRLQDYKDIPTLIEEIKSFIAKYYDFGEEQEEHLTFSAWYVLLTWVYDRINTIPYLRALGDYGTGKTRFLKTVGQICYKPIRGSGAGSMASLKRMVDKWRGTILTDEGDIRDDDEKNDLIKFYNLGIEKGQSIYQCDKLDPNKLQFFNPFCPKIILTRKPFKDQALESRCLTHITRETSREDIPVIVADEFDDEQEKLRDKLLKFRFDYYFEINLNKVAKIDLGRIESRLKQVMLGFASLFASMPEVMDEFREFLQKYQRGLREDRALSFDGQIITLIAGLVADGSIEGITPKYIAENLGFVKQPSPVTIGRHLKGLGLTMKRKLIDGITKNVLLLDEGLVNAIKKYVDNDKLVKDITDIITDITDITDIMDINRVKQASLQPINKKTLDKTMHRNKCNNRNIKEKKEEFLVPDGKIIDNVRGDQKEEILNFIRNNPKCSYNAIKKEVNLDEDKLNEGLHYLKDEGIIWEPITDKIEIVE